MGDYTRLEDIFQCFPPERFGASRDATEHEVVSFLAPGSYKFADNKQIPAYFASRAVRLMFPVRAAYVTKSDVDTRVKLDVVQLLGDIDGQPCDRNTAQSTVQSVAISTLVGGLLERECQRVQEVKGLRSELAQLRQVSLLS